MKNDASGYLDLSPLYGNNLKEQHAVRDMDKCLGLLYNDTVAESRLFLMPPQVVAYLVLFNRNHNYIADMLYKINEKGKFRDPATYNPDDKESVKHFEWQERELFETARLINCGHFIQWVYFPFLFYSSCSREMPTILSLKGGMSFVTS